MSVRPWYLLALVPLFVSATAVAYVRSTVPKEYNPQQPPLYWASSPTYVLNERGSGPAERAQSLRAARQSFETWNDIDCDDFRLIDGGTTSRIDSGYERGASGNINLVIWRLESCEDSVPDSASCWQTLDCGDVYNCWAAENGGDDTIAVTMTTFVVTTGEIVHASIEFNPVFQFSATDVPPQGVRVADVANTLTHEVGHFIGLDHSPAPEATMYARAPSGDISKRTLAQDDIDGYCAIVSPGGGLEPGLGSCEGCAEGVGSPMLLLLGVPLVMMLGARRKGSRKLFF